MCGRVREVNILLYTVLGLPCEVNVIRQHRHGVRYVRRATGPRHGGWVDWGAFRAGARSTVALPLQNNVPAVFPLTLTPVHGLCGDTVPGYSIITKTTKYAV